jgi:hypothetical protein
VFVDYPLGNPVGKPFEGAEQRRVVSSALTLLTSAVAPRMTWRQDLSWGTDEWRDVYMHVGPDNLEALAEAGRARREKQATKKTAPAS